MVSTKIIAGIVAVIAFAVIVYLFVAFAAAPENTVRVIDNPGSITGSAAINPSETAELGCADYCGGIDGSVSYEIELEENSDYYKCMCLGFEGNEIASKEIS